MLQPYPNTPPVEAVMALAAYLRGVNPDRKTAAHAAWIVSGYALGQAAPDGPPLMEATPNLTGSALADALEANVNKHAAAGVQGRVPWANLLKMLLPILLSLFGDEPVPTP